MQSLITCKFTSVISCVHVSEREAGLNLALYLSNTSPEDTDRLFEKSFAKCVVNSEKNFDVS